MTIGDKAHLTQEKLLRFSSGELPATEAETLYEHLGGCEACTGRFQAIQSIRAGFDGAWEQFVTGVGSAPALAPTAPGALEIRIRGIIDGARGLATAAADLVRAAGEASTKLTEWSITPAAPALGVGDERSDVRRLVEEAADRCAQGDDAGALATLGRIAERSPEASGSLTLDVTVGGTVVGQIVVQARTRSVAVLILPDRLPGAESLQVILEPEEPRAGDDVMSRRRVAPLAPVEGAEYLLAEFGDLDDGAFRLLLTP